MNFVFGLVAILLLGFCAIIAQVMTSKRKTNVDTDERNEILSKLDFESITPRPDEIGATDFYNTLPKSQNSDK